MRRRRRRITPSPHATSCQPHLFLYGCGIALAEGGRTQCDAQQAIMVGAGEQLVSIVDQPQVYGSGSGLSCRLERAIKAVGHIGRSELLTIAEGEMGFEAEGPAHTVGFQVP